MRKFWVCSVQLYIHVCITERVRSIAKQSRRGVYNPFSQGNTSGGMQTRELLEMVVTIGRLSSRRKKVREFWRFERNRREKSEVKILRSGWAKHCAEVKCWGTGEMLRWNAEPNGFESSCSLLIYMTIFNRCCTHPRRDATHLSYPVGE